MSVEEFYNRVDINPPPFLSLKVCCKNPEETAGRLRNILLKIEKKLNNLDAFHKECALLSRLIYRWKLIMRQDKGFKGMGKVKRCLLQYLKLELNSTIQGTICHFNDDYAPSRQIIEWILVRLQGLSKLFDKVYHECMETATYLKWRFQTGHVWSVSLLSIAVLSRIWVFSQYLVKESCNWYSQLKGMLPILQPSMVPWLPSDYKLPESLVAWLGHPDYFASTNTVNTNLSSFLKENVNEENTAINEETIKEVTNFWNENLDSSPIIEEDFGEIISRDEENITNLDNNSKESKVRNNKKKMKDCNENGLSIDKNRDISVIDGITSRNDLIRFVTKEKKLRNLSRENSSENCLTSNMDKIQWRMFYNFMKSKVKEIDENPLKQKIIIKKLRIEIKEWIS